MRLSVHTLWCRSSRRACVAGSLYIGCFSRKPALKAIVRRIRFRLLYSAPRTHRVRLPLRFMVVVRGADAERVVVVVVGALRFIIIARLRGNGGGDGGGERARLRGMRTAFFLDRSTRIVSTDPGDVWGAAVALRTL